MNLKRPAALAAGLALFGAAASGQGTAPSSTPPSIAELVRQLKDADADTRMEAAATLATFGSEARVAVPNLVEALRDPVAPVRMKAIDALMRTGAAEAAPRIAALFNDPDVLVRVSVVTALPRVSSERASTVPLLEKALGDKESQVRRRAAIVLLEIGVVPPAAVLVLREGLKEAVPRDRLEAMAALAKVGSPEEGKAMIALMGRYLEDPDPDTRVEAIRQLSGLGADGVPLLIGILEAEGEPQAVRVAAVRALGRIGPEAKAALPVLRALEQRKGPWARMAQWAIAAIEGSEPRTGQAAPANPVPSPGVPSPH